MTKIKVREATNLQLDWLVAKIEEESDKRLTLFRREAYTGWPIEREIEFDSAPQFERWSPTRLWAQGGPIIEREGINGGPRPRPHTGQWQSFMCSDRGVCEASGPTPLIAAMRCYVASKLGDEVEIPEELT